MYKIISLGAGVQSSAILLLSCVGEIERADYAIFADTQAEPGYVYQYLDYLRPIAEKAGIPILVVSAGNLLQEGKVKMPAFTDNHGKRRGIIRRQCTSDFKVKPLSKAQRKIAGLEPGQRVAAPVVETWLGISCDEASRMKDSPDRWRVNRYPLIELGWRRDDCVSWLEKKGFQVPRKSACYVCPYRSDAAWVDLANNYPDDFAKAVEYDSQIRNSTKAGVDRPVYLHSSLRPLSDRPFTGLNQRDLFGNECDGVCGV